MSEREGLNPEQDRAYDQLRGFFGRAESEFPAAAGQLVNVVGSLVGEERTTQEKLQEGMGNIDVGLALIGEWLRGVGADGFEVKLGLGGGAKKAIGRSKVKFPTASDLIRIGDRQDSELQTQIPSLLSSFSQQIRGGLDVGLSPRQIIGGLVAESVGSKLSANGSANLRQTLEKPLGGHFEWIKEALGITDAAEQSGFKPMTVEAKPATPPKPLPEVSRAEVEFIRKKNRIKEYLIQEGGMDFLARTWDEDKWEHVGDDGSIKRVYRPRRGVLAGEKVCLRENISDQIISYRESAPTFRPETRFLKQVKGLHFVRVYAHAPLDSTDSQGVGGYKVDRHWELVDFVEGVTVERKADREHGIYWPEPLSPAVRLKVVLAACENENEALSLARPVYLTDLKTDAFIVSPNGDQIKQVDCQVHDDSVDFARPVIARELVRLCLELFPGSREFLFTDIEKAVGWYLEPQRYENDKRYFYGEQNPPTLPEILIASRSGLPAGVESGLLRFLDEIKAGELPVGQIPMRLAERILPIAQRLEREESAAKATRAAKQMQEEIKKKVERRIAPPFVENRFWREAAAEMVDNPFAKVGYERTGNNEIVAAAAFEFRQEIGSGTMTGATFKAMMREINRIAEYYEIELGSPATQRSDWSAAAQDMENSAIARIAFERTGSRIVAAAAYRFRRGIVANKKAEASFKAMMREINQAVGTYRIN